MKRTKRLAVLILAIILVCSLVISMGACQQVKKDYEVSKINTDYGQKVYDTMQMLATDYADRMMGGEGELKAAKFLSDTMQSYGYTSTYDTDSQVGLDAFKVSFTRYDGTNAQDVNAYNVIFEKKSANSKGNIILACQYDNLYGETSQGEVWKADGSYESGMSIAVMLALAEELKDKVLDYDITFAFFTGGSYGWKGAEHYISGFDREDIDNTLLMLNFSMLGGGDNLYLYSQEQEVSYDYYIRACFEGLTKNPANKNISHFILDTNAIYPYTHIGMVGNHYYFINKGIPTANLMSLNWSVNDNPMMTEMKGNTNVYHTQDDTWQMLVARKGEEDIKAMADNIVDGITSVLANENASSLNTVLELAKEEGINVDAQNSQLAYVLNIVLKIIVGFVLVVLAWSVKKYVQKNREKLAPKPQAEDEEPDIEPFDMQDFDKIVNEHTKNQNNKDNDIDDDPFV